MKRIPLTQGQFAIVNDDIYEYLNQFKWYALWNNHTKSFYAVRKEKWKTGKWHTIPMAREILDLQYGDNRQADHIDHNTLDNRILNLRVVTCQQNQFNHKNPKGYSWCKTRQKYQAQIRINGKNTSLGRFKTAAEAHIAYLEAKNLYHKF